MVRWGSLPLSVIGCVNLVKMIILPKFLYLFQNIVILIKKSFFKTLDKIIVSFICGKKPSRISKTQLQKPKHLGGLAMPNFLFYYWACNFQKLLYWSEDKLDIGRTDGVQLELSCQYHLKSVICASLPLVRHNLTSNTVVNNSIRIWTQFRKHFGIQSPSTLSPIKGNYMFITSCTDPAFTQWFENGIKSISNLYIENTFANFSQFSQGYSLPKNKFLRYLQIRSFVQKTFHPFPDKPSKSQLHCILELKSDRKGLVTQIYSLIQQITPLSTENLTKVWESDLGIAFKGEQWDSVLN